MVPSMEETPGFQVEETDAKKNRVWRKRA